MTRHHTPSRPDLTQPFLGSRAISAGLLTPRRLRSPLFTRVFQNVYVPAHLPMTHELRCRAAALIAPSRATLTGASAAAVRGYPLAEPYDPVEFIVTEDARFSAKRGVHIRRSAVEPADTEPWRGIRLASPVRTTFDILRDRQSRRPLPRVVAWLDLLLRDGFIDRAKMRAFLANCHEPGVVLARKALALTDPRSESISESEIRVWLRLGGLAPEPSVDVMGTRLALCFPRHKLAIEYDDSGQGNSAVTHGAVWRRHRLRGAGWEFVVVPAEQLESNPEGMVHAVREALHRKTVQVAAL